MSKKPVKQPLSKTVLIRMTEAERNALEANAIKEQRSLAAQARVLISRGMEAQKAA